MERKIDALQEEIARRKEELEGPWIQDRLKTWRVTLTALGEDVGREADLRQDEARLADLERSVSLHEEGLNWLGEAARVLSALARDRRTDRLDLSQLEARVAKLRHQLSEAGITAAWIDSLRKEVEPWRPEARPPAPEPEALQSLPQRLAQLRRWSRTFEHTRIPAFLRGDGNAAGSMVGEVTASLARRLQDLQARFGRAREESDIWSDEDLEALDQEAGEIEQGFRKQAEDLREAAIEWMTARLQELARVHWTETELTGELDALSQKTVGEPQQLGPWIRRYLGLRAAFLDTVKNFAGDLRRRLDDKAHQLEGLLEETAAHPLSSDTRQELRTLRYELGRLRNPTDPDGLDLMTNLPLLNGLEDRISRWSDKVREEREGLQRLLRELQSRHRSLHDLARRLDLVFEPALEELTPDIEKLSEGPSGNDLAEAMTTAEDLATRHQEEEERFRRVCERRLKSHLRMLHAGAEGLDEVSPWSGPPPEAPHLELTSETPLQTVAVVVERARRARRDLEGSAVQALQALEDYRRSRTSDLEEIPAETLGPEQRQTVQELRRRLDDEAWRSTGPETVASREEPGDPGSADLSGLLDELSHRAAILRAIDDFLTQRAQNEERARSRHLSLQSRLRALGQDRRRDIFPLVCDRIEALVYGVPQTPRRWSDITPQLDEAERLLQRVEHQTRRVAALELERAVQELRTRKAASELLEELARHRRESLPPAELRHRIQRAARSREENP